MPVRIIPIEPDPIATAPHRRFTPPRVWAPLTDAEWAALAPHIAAAHRAGRKVADPRGRMNAIFHMAVTDRPWRLMPEAFGKPDTISRHFRRWAHAALWLRLLGTARAPDAPKALRAIEYWLCRAARRAMRILGLDGALVAERLGTLTAMPVLPCYMPRPEKVAEVIRWQALIIRRTMADPLAAPIGALRRLLALERMYRGRPWHRRFAAP